MNNDWLNNEPIETEPAITPSDLLEAERRGFQNGVTFTIAQFMERADKQPFAVNHVCRCGREYFAVDADAIAKGWDVADGLCPACAKDTNRPYISGGGNSSARSTKIGNIRI